MKASVIIEQMQALVERYGDLPVIYRDSCEGSFDIDQADINSDSTIIILE